MSIKMLMGINKTLVSAIQTMCSFCCIFLLYYNNQNLSISNSLQVAII